MEGSAGEARTDRKPLKIAWGEQPKGNVDRQETVGNRLGKARGKRGRTGNRGNGLKNGARRTERK